MAFQFCRHYPSNPLIFFKSFKYPIMHKQLGILNQKNCNNEFEDANFLSSASRSKLGFELLAKYFLSPIMITILKLSAIPIIICDKIV